jgi:hypothetical protein
MTPVILERSRKGSKKMKFTNSEDAKLIALVGNNRENVNWELVATALGNRTARQCKDRYHAYLAPGLNKSEWSEEEDDLLLELVSKYGQKWKTLAPSFQGRPEVSLKNRYRLLQRRINKKEKLAKTKQLRESIKPKAEEKAPTHISSPENQHEDILGEQLFFDQFIFDAFEDDSSSQFLF